MIEYSGRVVVDGTNFTSTALAPGFFKCILLTRDGSTNTIWSNDGTPGNPWGSSLNGGPPNAAVELIPESESAPYVVNGQFKLRLGDGSTTPAINPSVLSDSSGNVRGEVYLRVWFSKDNDRFEQLSPDVKLASAPYAIWAGMAETVKDRAITTNKLADGAVTADKLAIGSVSGAKLQTNSVGADQIRDGSVTLAKLAANAVGSDQVRDGSIGTSKIHEQSILLTHLAPRATGANVGMGGVAISSSSGEFTALATNWTGPGPTAANWLDVPNLVVTLTTTGRPVLVGLTGNTNGLRTALNLTDDYIGTGGGLAYWGVFNEAGACVFQYDQLIRAAPEPTAKGVAMYSPVSAILFIDVPPPGQHTYRLRLQAQQILPGNVVQAKIYNSRLFAFEL